MPSAEAALLRRGAHAMTVCNACRYCEQYCPVFPAVERRRVFGEGDLAYLANLCHNCGECLYACQYAPPHEFAIDLPRTLAELRLHSYERYCWPGWAGTAFRRWNVGAALALALVMTAVVGALAAWTGSASGGPADFYAVVPHAVLVALFGATGLGAAAVLGVGLARFWRESGGAPIRAVGAAALARAVRDALTLRHLHGAQLDCTSGGEIRSPWRRWFHHCTLYGFLLCFASTSVAAFYHVGLGRLAPYAYGSLPVVLGTAGGLGLLVGPAGLWWQRRRRDEALGDPAQGGLDHAFLVLLFLTSLSGLLLLVLREGPGMPLLLVGHLGCVLALFLTVPYGKFVHGLYRTAALVRSDVEARTSVAGAPAQPPGTRPDR